MVVATSISLRTTADSRIEKKFKKKIKKEEEEEEEEEEEGRDFISYLISICSLQRLWLYGR